MVAVQEVIPHPHPLIPPASPAPSPIRDALVVTGPNYSLAPAPAVPRAWIQLGSGFLRDAKAAKTMRCTPGSDPTTVRCTHRGAEAVLWSRRSLSTALSVPLVKSQVNSKSARWKVLEGPLVTKRYVSKAIRGFLQVHVKSTGQQSACFCIESCATLPSPLTTYMSRSFNHPPYSSAASMVGIGDPERPLLVLRLSLSITLSTPILSQPRPQDNHTQPTTVTSARRCGGST